MPLRTSSTDQSKGGTNSGLSDLRALIRPKTRSKIVPVSASSAETKSELDHVDPDNLDRLIRLLAELEPQLGQFEQTDSGTKQLTQLSAMAKLVNRLADMLVEVDPTSHDPLFEEGIRQATQYWLNSGELLDPKSPANSKGFLGLRKAMPPEWAARLKQQLGLAPRVIQSLLLGLGPTLRTTVSQATWHGAVQVFVNDFRSTLHWTNAPS